MSYKSQWKVPSSRDKRKKYTVSVSKEGVWSCSCLGWTRHIPRKDCRHIVDVKTKKLAPAKVA